MAQTKAGALKTRALRAGLSVDEYTTQVDKGLKWCWKCRKWNPIENHCRDRSRYDGLHSLCYSCRDPRTIPGPSKPERQQKRKQGLAWCKRCNNWLPLDKVRGGLCREHKNEYVREYYAQDRNYRARRRQKTISRRRNIDPIPPEGQESILEEFNGICAYCEQNLAETWDHIIPVSKGGKTVPYNIVPACRSCNSSKKNTDLFEWADKRGIAISVAVFDRMALMYCP